MKPRDSPTMSNKRYKDRKYEKSYMTWMIDSDVPKFTH